MRAVKITPEDAEYPALLREAPRRPLFLFRAGAPVPSKPIVAVVGTRDPTERGRELAHKIGAELARRGCAVATGLARGIDEAAALDAKEAGGHVIAVLPYIYENGTLLNKALWRLSYDSLTILSLHLVKEDKRVKTWLVERNWIISGISAAVVVTEAKFRPAGWGTAHTVRFAAKMGRKVLIVEPQVNDGDVIKGFKELVKMGAIPMPDADKVVEEACREAVQRWRGGNSA